MWNIVLRTQRSRRRPELEETTPWTWELWGKEAKMEREEKAKAKAKSLREAKERRQQHSKGSAIHVASQATKQQNVSGRTR